MTTTSTTRRAEPAKIRRHLSRRRIGSGSYRVTYGGGDTDFIVERNGNEPDHSPLAWCLARTGGGHQSMDLESGTISSILDDLAKHFAGVARIHPL